MSGGKGVKRRSLFAILLAGAMVGHGAEPLSVEASLETFHLPEGFRIETVVSEPAVEEPVLAVFDGNGRMFVAEMRTYMQDIAGSDQYAPVSRVSLHADTNGDGRYDESSVFIDGLVLPRMLLPLRRGELLVNETNSKQIHLYRDTDHDGVADEKQLWFDGGASGGNLEHQQSGLIWALDNWMYIAIDPWRLRWNGYGNPPIKESTPPNGGQWGTSQDDYGKPWFVNAGGELGPVNFQIPIQYGALNAEGQLSPDFRVVYPLTTLPDMQAGPRQIRPEDQTLNHFTATCGPDIYRGDRLPESLRGDLFFSEPVGRVVRQAHVEVREGVTYLSNAYRESEFLRSEDPNSRIVNAVTAPDGSLYFVDMYRGIIQEGEWTTPDTYLYDVIKKHGLDRNIGKGRIYRVRHEEFPLGPPPRMYEESDWELVRHLAHPNGWWRDTAQKLLILREARDAIPALDEMARGHESHLARIHAMWTLEGLGGLKASLVGTLLKDRSPKVRVAAIRTGESLVKAGERSLEAELRAMLADDDSEVVIQALLTGKYLKWKDAPALLASHAQTHASKGVREIAFQASKPTRSVGMNDFSPEDRMLAERGETIYRQLCFSCHGYDGRGMPVQGGEGPTRLAPPLARSENVIGDPDRAIAILLKGLTGPMNGKEYGQPMVGMASNDDEWIASALTYVRNAFGNRAPAIRPEAARRVRTELGSRKEAFTSEELAARYPSRIIDRTGWVARASHRSELASRTFGEKGGGRWDTQANQAPGMWVEVDFGKPLTISALTMDTAPRFQTQHPLEFVVQAWTDDAGWSDAGRGSGDGPFSEASFEPVLARRIRIMITGESAHRFWSMRRIEFFGPASQGSAQ